MAKISIKCPKCGQAMAIEHVPGIEEKTLTCINANCKHADKVKNFPPNITLLSLTYPKNEKPFPLKVGRQVIGRYSQKAGATQKIADIQINTTDHTMSRNQGAIIVEIQPGTNTPVYLFEEFDVANHTIINGVTLETGDIVYLNPKDKFTMGETDIILIP